MAKKEDLDLDLSDEDEAPSGGSKKKLLIIIILVVLFGAGIGSFFLFRSNTVEEKPEEEAAANEPLDINTISFRMPNPVDANIAGGGKRGRLLQVRVAFQLKSPEAEDAVKKNLAVIKNKILMKFQLLDGDKIGTREAKEQLKKEILEELHAELTTRTGKPHIEKILFTSFVMQ